MGTHSGPRRSDVFFESTVAKQIALIEAGLQERKIYLGNLDSVRTFQDARDAIRAYWQLALALEKDEFEIGEVFNIAGEEIYELTAIVQMLIEESQVKDIDVVVDSKRLRPIDADYQMFECENCGKAFTDRPAFSGSVGACYRVACQKCGMITKFEIRELDGKADIYQELQEADEAEMII